MGPTCSDLSIFPVKINEFNIYKNYSSFSNSYTSMLEFPYKSSCFVSDPKIVLLGIKFHSFFYEKSRVSDFSIIWLSAACFTISKSSSKSSEGWSYLRLRIVRHVSCDLLSSYLYILVGKNCAKSEVEFG